MTTLYLIRHAHADWLPDEARPLTAAGHASAEALAERLGGRPITAIYSSPARRAIETVLPLARRLGVVPILVPELRERELVVPPHHDFQTAAAETWRTPAEAWPRSESNLAAQARVMVALDTILSKHREGHATVATHGTLLALMLNRLDAAFGFDFWRRQTFPDVYEATFERGALVGVRRNWEP